MDWWTKKNDGKSALHTQHRSNKTSETFNIFINQSKVIGKLMNFYAHNRLPISVGALYARKYFPEESKKAAASMVKDIHVEFLNTLHNTEWMDEGTRAKAIQKAEALTIHIAYPNELTNVAKLEELYKNLEMEPDNLLQNTLRLGVYTTDHSFNQLRKPVNKTDWETHSKAALVNAYYNGLENSIRTYFSFFFFSFFL